MSKSIFLLVGSIILAVCVCSHARVVPYEEVDVKPQPVSLPTPEYPEEAREAGMKGTVITRALVDIDGKIAQAKIVKSSGHTLLDNAAIETAKKAIFTPAQDDGKMVQCWVAIPYKFTLMK